MAEWFDSLAEGWPTTEGAWIADSYDDLEDAWLHAQTEFKLWLAARLAPGWPERIRLLAATARAIDVNLAALARNVDFPLDAIPDVVGTLSRVTEPGHLPPYPEGLLTQLEALEDVASAKASLAAAWMQLADPARRSEDTWRERTMMLLVDALLDAYMAFRMLGPFAMFREADEAITSEADWVV
jgi:hypothetical protein